MAEKRERLNTAKNMTRLRSYANVALNITLGNRRHRPVRAVLKTSNFGVASRTHCKHTGSNKCIATKDSQIHKTWTFGGIAGVPFSRILSH